MLPILDVSRAQKQYESGSSLSSLASKWIADNRTVVDAWLFAARKAG